LLLTVCEYTVDTSALEPTTSRTSTTMDQPTPTTQAQRPAQRDMMFCHECNDEWYRDEHGLTCPECGSDFTEIVS
jgi:Zn finger protein HypA/HybF involved in hydrogenase expression